MYDGILGARRNTNVAATVYVQRTQNFVEKIYMKDDVL